MILACTGAQAQPKWTQLPAPSDIPNYGAFFTDSLNGVITNWRFDFSGTGAEIYHTVNGGASWSQAFSSTGALFAVSFADKQNGIAVGGESDCICGAIYRTTNGGASWSLQQTVSDATPSLYSVTFVNSEVGFVGGDDGALLKTTNGGVTWTKLTTGTSGVFRNVQFVDPQNGFAIVAEPENSLQGKEFFKTTDGGVTWKKVSFNNYVPQALWFTSPKVGYIGGNAGRPSILKTTDGGATWSEKFHQLAASDFILSVQFVNPYVGYAVGGNPNFGQATSGEIISTTDGGETWTVEEGSYQHTLRWVHFPTEKVGYVVGEGGTILKTSRKLFAQPMPTIKVNREALDFGSLQVGENRTLTVDISPLNIAGLRVDSVTIAGAGAGSYTFTTSKPLPYELRTNEKLSVSVTFTAAQEGSASAQLAIATNDTATTRKLIALTGEGSAAPQPAASFSVDSLGFGEVNVGGSRSLAVTISPANSAGLAVDSVYLSGAAIAGLTVATSLSLPAALSAGEDLTVTITYQPSAEGSLDGMLVVRSNDAAAARMEIPVTGSGRTVASAPATTGSAAAPLEATIEPNPARNHATLRLKLGRSGPLMVELFDDRGAVALSLPERIVEAGEREIAIDTRGLAAGVYHCRVSIGDARATTRLVVLQ